MGNTTLTIPLNSKLGRFCKQLYRDYRGRLPVRIRTCQTVRVHDYWDGGSRTYVQFASVDGSTVYTSDQLLKPENRQQQGNPYNLPIGDVPLVPGVIAIERSIFCGKDRGFTVLVHPDDMPKLLPAPAPLHTCGTPRTQLRYCEACQAMR
jgi:hypothetical protein